MKKTNDRQREAIYLQGKDPRTYEIKKLKVNRKSSKITTANTVRVKWKNVKDGFSLYLSKKNILKKPYP